MLAYRIRGLFVLMLVAAAAVNPAVAGIVTLDVANKTANSDTDGFEPKGVKVIGDQAGLQINNKSIEPQKFTLKVTGIKPCDYDLYVNGNYSGVRKSTEFESGIELSIPGRVVAEEYYRCAEIASPRIKAEIERIKSTTESEHVRALNTLRQASDWTASLMRNDATYRSIDVVMLPAGTMVQRMAWQTRIDAEKMVKGGYTTCHLLQNARDRMYRAIKSEMLRNSAVLAMTPVDMVTNYAVRNGNPHLFVQITNNCNLPISGKIDLVLPDGWKIDQKKTSFSDVKSGKMFKVTLDLARAKKDAAVPKDFPIFANITVVENPFLAKFTLRSVIGPPVSK